jgi:hypothetical protein
MSDTDPGAGSSELVVTGVVSLEVVVPRKVVLISVLVMAVVRS